MAASPVDDVPELIEQVILAAGEEAAQALVKHYGGTRAYLSTQRLAERVGERLAKKIIGAIGAGVHEVPRWERRGLAERNAEIIARRAAGETVPTIARNYLLTERMVRKILTPKPKPAAPAARQEKKTMIEHHPPPRPYIGPHSGTVRRYIAVPELDDFLELQDELARERGGDGLDEKRAAACRELWAETPEERRPALFQSWDLELCTLQQSRVRQQQRVASHNAWG